MDEARHVEGLALDAFNNMYRATQCELLKKITFNVMRDEYRHVSFGHVYLGPVIAKLDEEAREDLTDFAFQAVNTLMNGGTANTIASRVDPGFMEVPANGNIDPDDFFKGRAEAEEAGITQELPPCQIHSITDLMIPALARVGLITPTAPKKYEEAGVPIAA